MRWEVGGGSWEEEEEEEEEVEVEGGARLNTGL